MFVDEKCTNCDGMGYLFNDDLLFPDDKDKQVCPICFGIGYIFHYKRGSCENKNA